MDMDESKTQAQKLDEFIKNTNVERSEAISILTRNKWNLGASYKEIEQIRNSAGQRNHQSIQNDHNRLKDSPKHKAIEQGVGAAVHLEKKGLGNLPEMSSGFNTFKLPQTNIPLSQRKNGDFSDQTKGLSVRMPTNSTINRQERIIPIQIVGGRTLPPPQSLADSYSQTPLKSSVDANLYSQSMPNSYVSTTLANSYQPVVFNDNAVYPAQTSVIRPSSGTDIPTESHQEDDDVFDDKLSKKPPPSNTYPRLKRGFSNILENESLVSEARHSVQTDILKDNHDNMYVQTFVLPNLAAFSEDFKAFLGKELIETSTLVSLEQAGRLNWWAELRLCQRLLPMATSGDGNCLLHAASLAMWGIHDRQLILRTELHDTLTNASYREALYRRWRYQQTMSNKQSGLVFSEPEWKEEWENILRLASPLPRGAPDPARFNNCCDSAVTHGRCDEPVVYESLEEFHVFVLAHVLQRPIIVVADAILKDSNGEALAPIPFPGIYLPLEVTKYFRSPLLLTYDAAHFSALSPMEQDPNILPHLPAAIPLVDPELKLLPLHFYVDPGSRVDWSKDFMLEPSLEDKINLLQKFLDVDRIPFKFDINYENDQGSGGAQEYYEESGSLLKDKDKKKKDVRMANQVQTVARQFGSIGKSMGKKLKQLGKVGKGDKSRQTAVGNEITQSTRVIPNYDNQRSVHDVILVAKLSEKRGKQQQEMVKNYLQDAEERFKSDRDIKRRSDAELRMKVPLYPDVMNQTSGIPCSTPHCSNIAAPQTNYLCTRCFNAHRLEIDMGHRRSGQNVYNTFPGRGKQPPPSFDETITCGKSTFYTPSIEDVPQGTASLGVNNLNKQISYSSTNVHIPRARSPSPDYDNVPVSNRNSRGHQQATTKTHSTTVVEDRQQCRATDCKFYGSREFDGLCSQCYKMKNEGYSKFTHSSTRL
ncbi:unnamed protein product [Lymnaea stagnalis]|uniref:ubiquitinyl hydrolase 1 n=1 Tax=Lymnaea stagnalis TaxID=6523 RepID=A0AAV2H3D0_LYMST